MSSQEGHMVVDPASLRGPFGEMVHSVVADGRCREGDEAHDERTRHVVPDRELHIPVGGNPRGDAVASTETETCESRTQADSATIVHNVLLQQGTPKPRCGGFYLVQANGVR